jgi:hypothetical protein
MIKTYEIALTAAMLAGTFALVVRNDIASIRWNLQTAVFLLAALCASVLPGCASAPQQKSARAAPSTPAEAIAEHKAEHRTWFTHEEVAAYPEPAPCRPIPPDMTLEQAGIAVPEGMDRDYLHADACLPPSADEWSQRDKAALAFYADSANYTTVFDPVNCEAADDATTLAAAAAGGREGGPLFKQLGGGVTGAVASVAAGYAVAKWAEKDPKRAKVFCLVKLGAAVWNVAWILGL